MSTALGRRSGRAVMITRPRPSAALVIEATTLLAVVVLCGWAARPLLEEWGFVEYYDLKGLGGYPTLVEKFPLRPLQGVPAGLQWLLSAGRPAGFAFGFAVLLLAKYAVARWAVRPVLPRPTGQVVALLATLLVPWAGAWHLRFSPAQLSALFLLVALGAALRAADARRIRWTVTGAAAVLLMLATYQALFLCALTLPVVAALAGPADGDRATVVRRGVRAVELVVLGGLLYGAYSWVATRTLGSGYEGDLAADRPDLTSPRDLAGTVATLYRTAWDSSRVVAAVLVLVVVLLLVLGAVDRPPRRATAEGALLVVAALLLPLLALPYAVSTAFLHDPERVGFPVAMGLGLLAVVVAARGPADRLGPVTVALVSGLLLAASAVPAAGAAREYRIQKDVLVQSAVQAARADAGAVVIRDETGELGDVYTFLPPMLEVALRTRGAHFAATICTPAGTTRHHDAAAHLGIATTPDCAAIPPGNGVLLDATWDGTGHVVLRPAP